MPTAEEFVETMRAAIRLGLGSPEGDRLAEEGDRMLAEMPPEEDRRVDRLLDEMMDEEIIKSGRLAAALKEFGG